MGPHHFNKEMSNEFSKNEGQYLVTDEFVGKPIEIVVFM